MGKEGKAYIDSHECQSSEFSIIWKASSIQVLSGFRTPKKKCSNNLCLKAFEASKKDGLPSSLQGFIGEAFGV